VNRKNLPAEEIALRLLARRDHSRQELRQKLLMRKVSPAEADAVLERLAAQGLVNDARYARRMAVHLSAEKLLGPRRIREHLARRGVSADLLGAAEEAAERETPPEKRVQKLAESKLKRRTLEELAPPEKRRLARFLYQRGFSWDDIQGFFHKAGGGFEE
jgi:regulatory protein